MGFAETQSVAALRLRLGRVLARDDHVVLVVERNDDLIGYAWAQDYGPHLRAGTRAVRLHDLFVAPPDRRQGTGRRLFEAVRAWATEREATWLQWQAGSDSRAFYETLGLEPTPSDEKLHPFYELELTPPSV